MHRNLAFFLILVVLPPRLAFAMRQPAPLEANGQILSGLEESLWAAQLQKLGEELREDLSKPVSRRPVRQMYIRELAYRDHPEDEHAHHVGAFLSPSPDGPAVGFLPMRYAVIDRDRRVRPGPKIHLLQELKDEREPIRVIVREIGRWHKPGHHLDFIFMMSRPFEAQEVENRQLLIHYPNLSDRSSAAGLEEEAAEEKGLARFL